MGKIRATGIVVVPVGPGRIRQTLDTIESIWHYLGESQHVITVDGWTDDETHQAIRATGRQTLHLLRNPEVSDLEFVALKNAQGFRYAIENFDAQFLLKMDTDALVTGFGLVEDVLGFMGRNPHVGIFGRHLINVDGTIKSFRAHTDQLNREMSTWRRLTFRQPAYAHVARQALARGWGLGENVFGGAYFITWPCLKVMYHEGHLNRTMRGWGSRIAEDVYFTMCAVAAGFDRGQFGVPNGPLCLAWKKLPLSAEEIRARGYKLVHSVDYGENVLGAREFFRRIRQGETQQLLPDRPNASRA